MERFYLGGGVLWTDGLVSKRDPPYHEIFAVKQRKFNYPFRANQDLAYLKRGITLA